LVQSAANAGTFANDVFVFCCSGEEQKRRELEARGVTVEQLPPADGRPDFHIVLRRLGQLEITSLMIEGGAAVNGTALASGVVDKIFLYYTPKILGGTESVPFASGASFRQMNDPLQVNHIHLHRFGKDFAVEGYLHDPYEE
jgi:diaminohydroxyphosphoribosylaminopyrimidine deaminase/5-amino-6-(5-phosphoribosylamino)uracil reductase